MYLKKTGYIVVFFCIVKLALHLIADCHSGFQGDEFLHIECGNHPNVGYMEFPPLIGFLAFIQNHIYPQSVFVDHIFAHLASLLIIVVVALTTIALGGGARAVFIALLCLFAAPCFGRSQQLFQPVVFSQFFWLLAFYQLVMFVKTLEQKYLFFLTAALVFGFLTKYDIVFFIAGLSSLLFFARTRKALFTGSFWMYILFFVVAVCPNVWWQYRHGFPVFHMFSRLYQMQLNQLTAAGVIKDLIITLNPFTAIIWIGGFVFMFRKGNREHYRPMALSIVLSIAALALGKSKAYYFYPAMITLLVFGSIWFEKKVLEKLEWLIYPATAVLVITGMAMMPLGLAVLPLDSFIAYAHIKEHNGNYPVDCQEFYGREKVKKTLSAIKSVYDSLPENERKNCLIWGKHYSQAGEVALYRQEYQLPKAFSYHGSFYLWAPKGSMPETVIAFTNREAGIDFFQNYFDSVVAVKQVYNPYANFDKDLWQTIYICKQPRQTFDELREEFRTRIFE